MTSSGHDVEYTIAGDGPLKSSLEALGSELGVADRIDFTGSVDSDEVAALYNCSDIFLLPSIVASDGDTEGIPMVLMEAMATGLPVVSSIHSGIGELVVDGQSGFLVRERDVEDLADRLAALLDNPEARPRMGRRGRQFVQDNYEIADLNRQIEALLGQLG